MQWPFGYGLSYSEVEYSNLQVALEGDKVKVAVDVKNVSERPVKEPVLVFVSDLVASLTPDIKRLRAFDKVELGAGEMKTAEFEIALKDLAFVDEDLNWVLEKGEFKVAVDNLESTFLFE